MSTNNIVILNSKGDVALVNIINRQSELSTSINNIPYVQDVQFQNIYETTYPLTPSRNLMVNKIIQVFGGTFPDVDTSTANLLLNQILIENSATTVEDVELAVSSAISSYYDKYKSLCTSMVDLLSQLANASLNTQQKNSAPIDVSYAKNITSQLSITQSTNTLLTQQVNHLRSKLAEMQEQENKLRERLINKDKTIDSLQAKIQMDPNVDLKTQLGLTQMELMLANETIVNLQKQVSLGSVEQVETLSGELKAVKKKLKTLQAERDTLKEQVEQLTNDYNSLTLKNEEQNMLLMNATNQVGQSAQDYANIMEQLLVTQQKLTDANATINKLTAENLNLKIKPNQLQSQLEALNKRYARLAFDYTETKINRYSKR
jgi:chromosome segregation ATPase